ncbi:MAG TPA: CoA transferase [Bradyrhizobium sp.]|nr:CoA transferase [Bradyrhizobium sp.]
MTDRSSSNDAAPLAGVRVLDFTHVLAGPFCTRLLADLGADVVRVESSKHPDHPWPSAYIDKDGRHASYLNTNRNKRSIAIDLKQTSGRQAAVDLAARADVVVENFSAGVMDRLGLGYETLRSRNPGIVYVSMSGYGHDGPRRDWTSMNMNLQGYSGLMTVTGAPGDPPTAISNSWNDYIGGLHACFAILQALDDRGMHATGTRLDLSQFECSVAMIAPLLLASAVTGRNPPRLGNRSARFAPQGVYRCAGTDNWCVISVRSEDQWRSLGQIIGEESWAGQERFATVAGRRQWHDEIDEQLSKWTRTLSNLAVEQTLKAGAIAAERVRRIDDLINRPAGATVFHQMDEPRLGSMLTTVLPFRFSTGSLPAPSPAPALGQHSDLVLRDWLDFSQDDIQSLKNHGALT